MSETEASVKRNCYDEVVKKDQAAYCQQISAKLVFWLWTPQQLEDACNTMAFTVCDAFVTEIFSRYKNFRSERIERLIAQIEEGNELIINNTLI
jgi:hypothetical protein